MISKLFMQALSPISEAISDYMNKKFSGRKLFVGIDWPFMGGASEIWFAIIVAIPFTLLWALILPGNKILPFAGIMLLLCYSLWRGLQADLAHSSRHLSPASDFWTGKLMMNS